jgi:pyruvate dehydrogenase E1 component
VIAASDYIKALPLSVGPWLEGRMTALGCDGYGRSDGRDALRRFFEVDAAHIAYAALSRLFREGSVDAETVRRAARELEIDSEIPNPIER